MTKIMVEIVASVRTGEGVITSQSRALVTIDDMEDVVMAMAQETTENMEIVADALKAAGKWLDDSPEDDEDDGEDDNPFRDFINDLL